jgi:hypothetical protein
MRSHYFWPITLILLGVLLLLDNLGILPGGAWGWIWPIVLIWLGLSLLLGRRGRARFELVEDSLPLDGATSARMKLRHGAGRLVVRAGAAPALLFAGTFGGGVDKHVDRSGDLLDVVLQAAAQDWTRWMGPWNWGGQPGGLNWTLGLNPTIPLELTLETGASESALDLSALRVTDLAIKTGASSTEVTLPAQAGQMRAKIESGAASVRVSVPSGVAARIRGHMGVGELDVDQGRFPRRSDGYESDDFETAANRVELEIQGGVGQVSVR